MSDGRTKTYACTTKECQEVAVLEYDGFPLCPGCTGDWLAQSYAEQARMRLEIKELRKENKRLRNEQ